MATTRKFLVALVAVLMAMPLLFAAPASGQAASPCPPGQPPGRPPGVPPGPPGSPPGAPEGRPPQYTSLAECQLRLSQSSASAGERVTLSGAGYGAASAVTLTLNSTPMSLGQATTDSSGAFSRTVTIPAAAEVGSHTITAAGVDPAGVGYVLSAAFEVTAGAAAPASGTLPRTGAGTFAMVMVALLLVAAGAALVVAARRRRSTAPITP